jgi:YgiT-type zinc finger domain-containing protein
MSRKPPRAKERCAVCGGELRHTTVTHEERRGTKLYLFQNVPAQVCTACGEAWIEEATLQAIERLIREGEPTRKVETPVYDLAVAGLK